MFKKENSSQGQSPLYREVLEDGIVHFDATGARREAMRKRAATRVEISSNESPKNGEAHRDLPTEIVIGGNGVSKPIAKASPSESYQTNRLEYQTEQSPIADVMSWKERVHTSAGVPSGATPALVEREISQKTVRRDVATDLADAALKHAPPKAGISRNELQ